MNMPFGVIINRDGIGDKKVELFCKDEKIPILLKIPESREIANLYSKGITLVEKDQKWRDKFLDVFEKIEKEVNK